MEIIKNCLHHGAVQVGISRTENGKNQLIIKNSFTDNGVKVIEKEYEGIIWYANRIKKSREELIYNYQNNKRTARIEMIFSEGEFGNIRLCLKKNFNKLNSAVHYYINVLNMVNSKYSHGDYTLENILFNKRDEVVRVIDWEHFDDKLPKEFDLLHCVLENCFFVYRKNPKLLKKDIKIAKDLLSEVSYLTGVSIKKFNKPGSYFRKLCLDYKYVFGSQIMKYPFVNCSLKDIEIFNSIFE